MSESFEKLKQFFTGLPGVGPRQAARFALSLLQKDEQELIEFARAIANLKEEVKLCQDCSYVSEGPQCSICTNSKRDKNKIMVVEKITDLESIERSGHYRGLYHILGGVINPPDGIGPNQLNIKKLISRIQKTENGKAKEVILALSPTPFGNMTSLYLQDQLKKFGDTIVISTLGRGLSFGTSLEYVDEVTLKEALEKRG